MSRAVLAKKTGHLGVPWESQSGQAQEATARGAEQADLSGRVFMFDYGEIAKFLLRFTACRTVEVTVLEADLYSVTPVETFAVEIMPLGEEIYRISWDDPGEETHLSHLADFQRGSTAVTIEDRRLAEVRHYEGAIFGG